MLRYRKCKVDEITRRDLEAMDKALSDFHVLFKRMIAPLMPSGGHTIKYHRLSHVTSSIRMLGHLRESNAQFFEASNRHDKALYRATNARTTDDRHLTGMVTNQQLRTALALDTTSKFNQDQVVMSKGSAYIAASKTGENTMARKALFVVSSASTSHALGAGSISRVFLDGLADYDCIRQALAAYFGVCDISSKDMPIIMPRATAVLCAVVPWLSKNQTELQTIRCTPTFHSRPYFDCVAFDKNGGEEFGRLRLMCEARAPLGSRQVHKVVCLKVFQRTALKDILVDAGCIHLQEADEYIVVPLEKLQRRVYVIEDFARASGFYHVSAFKWNRRPIDLDAGIEDD